MARGFWTGLLHGGVLSAGALILLALVLPLPVEQGAGILPDPQPESVETSALPVVPEAQPDTVMPAAPTLDEAAGADQPAAQEMAEKPDVAIEPKEEGAPAATALDLPVGSEFARGGDVAPRLPEPLATPSPRLDQSEAPAVTAPAAEPAPITVTGDARRPEAATAGDGPGLTPPEIEEIAPVPHVSPASQSPVSRQAPQMAGEAGQDNIPELSAVLPDQGEADQGISGQAAEPVTSVGQTDAPQSVPALSIPAPNLSLPPDLTDLRGIARE